MDGEPIETKPPAADLQAGIKVATLSGRAGSSLDCEHVDSLQTGARVEVAFLAGDNGWVQIAPEQWVHCQSCDEQFMELG